MHLHLHDKLPLMRTWVICADGIETWRFYETSYIFHQPWLSKQSHLTILKFWVLNRDVTNLERTEDLFGLAAFRFSTFSFKDQMPHIWDYLWEGKFPVEGLNKNKKVEFRKKYQKYKLVSLGSCCISTAAQKSGPMNTKVNIKSFLSNYYSKLIALF